MWNQQQPMLGAELAKPVRQSLRLIGRHELIAPAMDNECGDGPVAHIGYGRAKQVRLWSGLRGAAGKGLEIARALDPVWIPPCVLVRKKGRQVGGSTYRDS